jgi:hypothetical protein
MSAVLRRRVLLQSLLSAAALPHVLRSSPAQAAPGPRSPRYWITLLMVGGIDAVTSMDPKTRSDVASDIDVPYSPNEILGGSSVPLGPYFAPLLPQRHRFSLLRNVQVRAANHPTGVMQFHRMRTRTRPGTVTLHELLGRHRDGQPLPVLNLGIQFSDEYSSAWGGGGHNLTSPSTQPPAPLFDGLEALSSEERDALAAAFRRQSRQLARSANSESRQAAENLSSAARLLDRLQHTPRFQPTPSTSADPLDQLAQASFDRTLWALENDLTKCVHLSFPADFDSHRLNESLQKLSTYRFATSFARFLGELATRRNRFGPLYDQVGIVCASELGREPRLNSDLGKDHFPEAPFLFAGGAFRTAPQGLAFGETGKKMEARNIDLDSGQPLDSGHPLVLDDIGATLLSMDGQRPTRWGYFGSPLRFLFT